MDTTKFLSQTSWHDADQEWFSADWSPRRYARLTRDDGQTAMLMDCVPDDDPRSLIGHQLGPWLTINTLLHDHGLRTPQIYAHDEKNGFVLMEDFGHETIIDKGMDAYLAATDVLIAMRDIDVSHCSHLKHYVDTHVFAALRFYPEFILKKTDISDQWLKTWRGIMNDLPPVRDIFTHIDFFGGNAMWLPQETGTDRIGIVDFQGACIGPMGYDLVNLLEDIRHDIPGEIKSACIARYCKSFDPEEKRTFDAWYPVLTAQFHSRVLGQIIKLKQNGRDDLIQYYDGLKARLETEWNHPALISLQAFSSSQA